MANYLTILFYKTCFSSFSMRDFSSFSDSSELLFLKTKNAILAEAATTQNEISIK